MIDREKVIADIRKYINYPEPLSVIVKKAIELMKEQEAVEAKTMGASKEHGSWWFACGACGHAIDPEDNFCRECGRRVKWDD